MQKQNDECKVNDTSGYVKKKKLAVQLLQIINMPITYPAVKLVTSSKDFNVVLFTDEQINYY